MIEILQNIKQYATVYLRHCLLHISKSILKTIKYTEQRKFELFFDVTIANLAFSVPNGCAVCLPYSYYELLTTHYTTPQQINKYKISFLHRNFERKRIEVNFSRPLK